MKRSLLVFLSLPLVFYGIFSLQAEVVGKSIATVNGEAIYLSEFENNFDSLVEQQKKTTSGDLTESWKKNNRKLLLDQMIEEKLVLQEANRRKVVVPKRQLEDGILRVKNNFKALAPNSKPTKEEYERPLTVDENKDFLEELKRQGLTEKEFESKIDDQLKVMRLTEEEIRGKVPAPVKDDGTDSEKKELTPDYDKAARALYIEIEKKFNDKYFKADPDNETDQIVEVLKSKLGEAVHARHILIRSARDEDFKKRQTALEKAKSIKKELDEGADFIELAKKESDGPGAKSGGDLGFFTRGQMTPEFEKAAFSLPVGGISDPIETEFGYHIIMVEEKRAAKRLRYDDVKLDLANYLFQKKMHDRYEEFVADLRKKADVKVLIDLDKPDKG